MISKKLTTDKVRAILGDVCDYLYDDELQAILNFWDEKSGKNTELEAHHIQGWNRTFRVTELCMKELNQDEFRKLDCAIERKLEGRFINDYYNYTIAREALFLDYAKEHFNIIVIKIQYGNPSYLYRNKDI